MNLCKTFPESSRSCSFLLHRRSSRTSRFSGTAMAVRPACRYFCCPSENLKSARAAGGSAAGSGMNNAYGQRRSGMHSTGEHRVVQKNDNGRGSSRSSMIIEGLLTHAERRRSKDIVLPLTDGPAIHLEFSNSLCDNRPSNEHIFQVDKRTEISSRYPALGMAACAAAVRHRAFLFHGSTQGRQDRRGCRCDNCLLASFENGPCNSFFSCHLGPVVWSTQLPPRCFRAGHV